MSCRQRRDCATAGHQYSLEITPLGLPPERRHYECSACGGSFSVPVDAFGVACRSMALQAWSSLRAPRVLPTPQRVWGQHRDQGAP